MKGKLMLEILSTLDKGESNLADLIEYACNLASNFRRAEVGLIRNKKEQPFNFNEKDEKRKIIKRFYAMISYLEKDGLICRFFQKEKLYLKITNRGKDKLDSLKHKFSNALPDWDYKSRSDKLRTSQKGVVIVAFDIPEKERVKREWLRNALRSLDFEMLQRSVWMKKGGMPESFINDLKSMNLAGYVRIFQINRLGNLKQLV